MEYSEEKVVLRPEFGLWSQAKAGEKGRMDPKRGESCERIACPEVARFRVVRPPCLNGGNEASTRAEVRERATELEEEARKFRASLDQGVMGMTRVRRMRFVSSPSGREGFFGTVPEVFRDDREKREAMKWSLKEFLARYRVALDEYREIGAALFPDGTWWMRMCLRKECYVYCESARFVGYSWREAGIETRLLVLGLGVWFRGKREVDRIGQDVLDYSRLGGL